MRIRYVSFSPTNEQEKAVKNLMDRIYFATPSDSRVSAIVSRFGNVFEFQIQVVSRCFSGVAKKRSEHLILSGVHAKKSILEKMNQWKVLRFKDRSS